jgi:hypothetical protein
MAELNKTVLGRVSGRLGDMTFRQRNGKNIIGMRPSHYPTPSDQASVDRRARFRFTAKLAQAIYSLLDLTAAWRPVTPSGMSTFNYILQSNISLVNPGSVSEMTMITPPTESSNGLGFMINCTTFSVTVNAIAVELAAVGTSQGIDVTKEPNAKLVFVLSLTNPVNDSLADYWFVVGASDPTPLVLANPLSFNIPLSGQDAASVASYGDKKLLLALLTLDADSAPVKHSETLVK